MILKVLAVPALNDNYIWLLYDTENKQAICIDPGEAEPVIEQLHKLQLNLIGILITHHHWDHTSGIDTLLTKRDIFVYGPANSHCSQITHHLSNNDLLKVPSLNLEFKIIEIPGHTLDHIAYCGHDLLFCGDTLFSAGCGRIFEGSHEMMYQSLQKLARLPPSTLIYCAHEYTLDNLKFASMVEPDNQHIQNYQKKCAKLRQQQIPTLPSTIAQELLTNPFLRCNNFTVRNSAETYCKKRLKSQQQVFSALREWKNGL